jgi:hypothetical protein
MDDDQKKVPFSPDNSPVDPELKRIHQCLTVLYNRETIDLQTSPTKLASINATNFLAGQCVIFADSSLFLMADTRQPISVPVALLRTCLEAQARCNHIIAAQGQERETIAGELIRLMDLGHEYYEMKVVTMCKEMVGDPTKLQPRDRAYFPALKSLHATTDISKLKDVKKAYDELSRKWSYGKVVERERFNDSNVMKRSEAQSLQPALDLTYVQCCAFVHCDPVSIPHQNRLTRIGVAHTLVLSEIIAVMCFFEALDKGQDIELRALKQALINFDINERILPKSWL